jgi:hypothetical protein
MIKQEVLGSYEERERSGWQRATLRVRGKEFIIGFEGSQALPVCPSGKCKF